MSYYNTTSINGQELTEATNKASIQTDVILDTFRRLPRHEFTPCEIYKEYPKNIPLTSVRRAISDLTKQGYLIQTDIKRRGMYGATTHTWKLNEQLS